MAEARQAVAFQFAVTEEGVKIHVDGAAVKSASKALFDLTKSRLVRAQGAVLQGIFPASPLSLAVIGGAVAGATYYGRDISLGLNDWIIGILERLGIQSSHAIAVVLGVEAFSVWVGLSFLQRYALKGMLMYRGWMFDPHGRQSFKTKVWGGALRGLTLFTRPRLYSYQSSLPRLPVPALRDTCSRYLESVRPLMEDSEYAEMERLVDQFQRGPGRKMQRYLVFKSWWASNYVTDWWESYVYLHGRSSIMINSNYYACDMVGSDKLTTNQAARAGMLGHILMKLKYELEHETIQPLLVMGMIPLCSEQYRRLFGTTRIPGRGADKLSLVSGSQSNYCACCLDGRWFKVPLTTPLGRRYSAAELEVRFELLFEEKGREVREGEVDLPALTALGREEWAEAREEFFMDGVNKTSLDIIEKAAFVLMFDDNSPAQDASGVSAYCKDLLHGRGHTRWFDKSVTLVVYANGKVGVNAEHSWADAPIIGYLMEYSCNLEHQLGYQDNGHNVGYDNLKKTAPPPLPKRLEWELSAECVERISSAKVFAQEQIQDLDLYLLKHDEFGKGVMKKCKISPDAFIQMALQMAYFKDAGKFCLTYEASMTRLYLQGRTETVRPVTVLSSQFVRAMCDPNIKDTITTEEKRAMLMKATDHHARSYKKAMVGEGIDRHLFCLYVMSKYLKIESEFLSRVLHEPWRLSTSQTPSQQTGKVDFNKHPEKISGGGGFGPVAKDGYGVSYIIQGDFVIFFHVSAFRSSQDTDAFRFANHIRDSLRQLKELFQN